MNNMRNMWRRTHFVLACAQVMLRLLPPPLAVDRVLHQGEGPAALPWSRPLPHLERQAPAPCTTQLVMVTPCEPALPAVLAVWQRHAAALAALAPASGDTRLTRAAMLGPDLVVCGGMDGRLVAWDFDWLRCASTA